MMRRLYDQLRAAAEAVVARTLPVPSSAPALAPHAQDLDEELDEAAQVCLCTHTDPLESSGGPQTLVALRTTKQLPISFCPLSRAEATVIVRVP